MRQRDWLPWIYPPDNREPTPFGVLCVLVLTVVLVVLVVVFDA